MSDEKLTVEEAALRLKTSEDALRKRIRRGLLHAVKAQGRWWIPWPILEGQATGQAIGQDTRPMGQDTQAELKPEISLLEAQIEHLKETVWRLEDERDTLRQALEKAQRALLNQQSLSLPAAVKEIQALPENTPKRRWWEVWKR